jgi:hypothetical protein
MIKMIKGTYVLFKEVGKSLIIIFISPRLLSNKSNFVTDFGNFFDFHLATLGLSADTIYKNLFLLIL